ncbi:autotransporter outer membrane beta-barrel domain-containing protein [Novosphingobium sp. PC22D]|uniref:outer membrane protein n=1 Tax=Novosphingobium sp. PC22D TaxID=1962403 RepID=UPI000BF0CFE9|nr:outer membrane beta-barrel protein [Novosphingobium sp. PC22D]PEQ13767.1 autotransporter outer membrane beta-barrel domain-containing protein [Novosphingobium sp. PC22D]
MKKILVCLASGTALVSVPAMAQQADSPFNGPRVEAIVGYDVSKAGSSIDDDVNADNDESIDGFLYGIGAGYGVDLGSAVVGVEAELSDSTAKTKFDNGDFEGFGIGNVKANRDLYLGARAGIKATPRTLVYVKGGYTNAKFDVNSFDGTTDLGQDIDADGWRIGAGVEQAMSSNTFAKLEYRYSNYSKAEVDFDGDLPDSERFDVDLDRHQVVASVGVRF